MGSDSYSPSLVNYARRLLALHELSILGRGDSDCAERAKADMENMLLAMDDAECDFAERMSELLDKACEE